VLDFVAKPNMEPSRHTFVVRFGTFEVSLQSGEVRKAGVRIRVQQQPLKLLKVLAISTRRSTLQSPSFGAR
jgi:DNA-binding response OmpR family regulator